MEDALASAALPGERIGPYRLIAELGRGAMAAVYLARLEGPGGFERLCALKLIHDHIASDGELVELILAEARIAARIHHPNVIAVEELALHEGRYYLRMDYVSGETLFEALDRTWNREVPFPEVMAAQIIAGAADGLHAAHELRGQRREPLGVVHRDLGPHNIMLGYDGVVRVMDFGIAKALDQRPATQPGVLRGTLAFMSPEQVRGEPIDRRADLFSLGVLLWETTVGARLFKHATVPGTLARILEHDIPRPSALRPGYPPELERIVLRALERDRERRYPTAQAMSEELHAFLQSAGHVATPVALERFMDALFPERKLERQRLEAAAEQLGPAAPPPPTGEPPGPAEPPLPPPSARDEGAAPIYVADLSMPRLPEDDRALGTSPLGQGAGLGPDLSASAALRSPLGQGAGLGLDAASPEAPTAVTDVDRTPRRPTVARAPRGERNGRWLLAASLAALLATTGALAWVSRRPPPAPARAPTVTLSFELRPPDAELRVDGQVHRGDLIVPLSPQAYAVEVRAEGYRPRSLVVSAEASQHIQVELEPAPRTKERPRGRRRGR